jgi:hypothetical protein
MGEKYVIFSHKDSSFTRVLSTYYTTPITYNGGFYNSVEAAYQAQKINYICEDMNNPIVKEKVTYYLETLEFDQEHGLDDTKMKFISSKEGWDMMEITLNTKKWNYYKKTIMNDIVKKRYMMDNEFRYIVDCLNMNGVSIYCNDKNEYWRINNNLGKLMMLLQ